MSSLQTLMKFLIPQGHKFRLSRQAAQLSFICLLTLLSSLSACKRPPLPPPVVLFDQGHGQIPTIDNIRLIDLSKFAATFSEQGFQVKATKTKLTDELLDTVDALILSGPATPLSDNELGSVSKYLRNGGQLCLMLNLAKPATNLLTVLNVAVANKIVHERLNKISGQELNFSIGNLPAHPLTKNLSDFNLYGAWPLKTALEANVIGQTSDQAWVDLDSDNQLGRNDASQAFAVMITGQLGHGHFVIFGDDQLFANQYLTDNNQQLARNLAKWFKTGSYYR